MSVLIPDQKRKGFVPSTVVKLCRYIFGYLPIRDSLWSFF